MYNHYISNIDYRNSLTTIPATVLGYGLGGTVATTIGAAIRNNNIYNEAMTVLVGGIITGAILGALAPCFHPSNTINVHSTIKNGLALLELGLELCTLFITPFLGQKITNLDAKWTKTMQDEAIGIGIITVFLFFAMHADTSLNHARISKTLRNIWIQRTTNNTDPTSSNDNTSTSSNLANVNVGL